ncbi:hypothetical protein C8J57DRAFT_1539030 [Mycena rebaudengoi]|nr:hypothetical protein C8J57DRAFT_1539030 [Mycena rebaudengoi]
MSYRELHVRDIIKMLYPIRRHRGRTPELLVLLRRRAGRRALCLEPHHSGREDVIEDDWVDPAPPPRPVAAPAPVKSRSASGKGKERKEKEKRSKDEEGGGGARAQRALSVPVQQQQRAEARERERQRNVTVSPRPTVQSRSEGHRMHTARARRGRTQSGGVRRVLTTDD